ncbi:hypothetical protein AVEN_176611-1 [Araneus ventricosus]|uniref:Uncharacterized protein n=1 Tax=Araneus ventricosus TaxID=182803 RepID=A0A4Y2EJT0_ARAVE|nr:hypothetical protein AVEN_176611-1 [Araneus ventricosus]
MLALIVQLCPIKNYIVFYHENSLAFLVTISINYKLAFLVLWRKVIAYSSRNEIAVESKKVDIAYLSGTEIEVASKKVDIAYLSGTEIEVGSKKVDIAYLSGTELEVGSKRWILLSSVELEVSGKKRYMCLPQ